MADDTIARIEALEAKLDRVLELLEAQAARPWQAEADARIAEIQTVEGDVRAKQLGEALVEVSDPDVLGALVRIAQLAPQLEYAAQAVAAGPVLLDEGLQAVREQLGPHDDRLRIQAGMELVQTLGQQSTLEAATEVAVHAPALAQGLQAAGATLDALTEVHGDAVRDAMQEALQKLGDPEVIASLGRLAELAPQLEYAAYAAAAGPELLEDTLRWLREMGGSDPLKLLIDSRPHLERAFALLERVPDEKTLGELEQVFDHAGELAQAAPKMLELFNKVDVEVAQEVLEFVHDLETLSVVRAAQGAVAEAASAPPRHVGFFGLLQALNDPDVQRALGIGVDMSRAFAQRLKQLPVVQSK